MQDSTLLDLPANRLHQTHRDHRDPVVAALGITNRYLQIAEIDILDAKTDAFVEAQTAAVKQVRHEPRRAMKPGQHRARLCRSENHRQLRRSFCALDVIDSGKLLLKNFFVKKEESTESLVLGGGGYVLLTRQMRQERPHFPCAHLCRVLFAMKENETLDPIHIDLFSASRIMPEANSIADLVEEFPLARSEVGG